MKKSDDKAHRPGARAVAILAIVFLVASACTKNKSGSAGKARNTPTGVACGDSKSEINVQVASYDLAVGAASRFLVGILTKDNRFVSFGSVTLRFAYCGTKSNPQQGPLGPPVTGSFLPLPEEPGENRPPPGEGPAAVPASQGRGVYAAKAGFDQAGFWRVETSAELKGEGTRTGTADFEVRSKHRIPSPGDPAIASENLTLSSKDAPSAAIDSRAQTEEGIPDPELHQTTIAQALKQARPALVVFSTPVFCRSRFCGPVTDMVAELGKTYANRAAFIHVEIWRDFDTGTVNKAAGDWLFRDGDLTEPWVFLIGVDGKIVARWDNVATREEIEPLLMNLPAR